jgi:hypothetical protein
MRKQLSLFEAGCCASAKWILTSTAVISKNMADVISALQAIAYLLCRLFRSIFRISKKIQEKSLLSFITAAVYQL